MLVSNSQGPLHNQLKQQWVLHSQCWPSLSKSRHTQVKQRCWQLLCEELSFHEKQRGKERKKTQEHNLNNCAEHSHETNTLIQLMERPRDGQSDSLMLLKEIIQRPSHVPLHSRKQDFIRIGGGLSKKKCELPISFSPASDSRGPEKR